MRSSPMSNSRDSFRLHLSKGACDFCRQKRIKCVPVGGGESSLIWVQPGHKQQCNACQVAGSPCTYTMPVKKRGPAVGSKTKTSKHPGNGAQKSTIESPPEVHSFPSPASPYPWIYASPLLEPSSNPNIEDDSTSVNHTQTSPVIANTNTFPAGSIFPRPVYLGLIETYLDLVYPTIPIIHRPTFLRDIQNNKDTHDDTFLSLTVSICAAIIALIPRKFEEYQNAVGHSQYRTRTQMVNACCKFVVDLRPTDYFDEINLSKWATAFMFQIAYFQLGVSNRVAFWYAEAAQMTRLLRIEDSTINSTLNCIDNQLRKKAFWLTFFIFVHQHIGNIETPFLKLYDTDTFNSIVVEDLWPVEVDDEYIKEEIVLPQPENIPNLTAAFNAGAHLFWIGSTHRIPNSIRRALAPSLVAKIDLNEVMTSLNCRLEDLHATTKGLVPNLKQWNIGTGYPSNHSEDVTGAQIESLRANIQVTRLWLQSTLLETLFALEKGREPASGGQSNTDNQHWHQREYICQQLLSVIYNISQCNLEPNGNSLTMKIRQVAATLLGCPLEQQGAMARRAESYLNSFVEILTRLDVTEHNRQFVLDTQAWSDLSILSKDAWHSG